MLKLKFVITLILALALASCSVLRGGATPTPTVAPSPLPSTTPAPSGTATLASSDTPSGPTTTPILEETDTPAPGDTATVAATSGTPEAGVTLTATAAATAGGTAAPQGNGTDKADFVSDVTVPDGTSFTSGQAFVKTWQLKNTGTNAWTTGYALVYVRGDQMGGPASVPLSQTVAAGATANLSVSLTAPNTLGTYTGFWMLRNAAGTLFGIGADSNQPVYLKIIVGAAAGTPLPTGVPGVLKVSAVSLSVDQTSFTGACPRTFTFTGDLTSSGSGTISYQLEAASEKPGFVFNLPKPVDTPFNNAGPRTFSVQYQLQFTASVSGTVWLHVLKPNDMSSSKVAFSLTCQP